MGIGWAFGNLHTRCGKGEKVPARVTYIESWCYCAWREVTDSVENICGERGRGELVSGIEAARYLDAPVRYRAGAESRLGDRAACVRDFSHKGALANARSRHPVRSPASPAGSRTSAAWRSWRPQEPIISTQVRKRKPWQPFGRLAPGRLSTSRAFGADSC